MAHHLRTTPCYVALGVLTQLIACTKTNIQQCSDSAECDYRPGGECLVNEATGRQWCAFTDSTCPSGMRWGDITIGDDLSGTCVTAPDAALGPDAANACDLGGGMVVYSTGRTGNLEIARSYANGSGFMLLTTNSWSDSAPRLSPNGSRVAWVSRPSGQDELYVMNVDGSDAHDVSAGNAREHRWSPEGDRLVFTSNRDGNDEIYSVNADGSGLVNLSNNAAADATPDWAPDGARIVFGSTRDGSQLYTMNADGSAPTPITDRTDFNSVPRWAQNDGKIAWLATSGTLAVTLWAANPDGSSAAAIDSSGAVDADGLEWSPDGTRLAYSRVDVSGANSDIYTVTAQGTGRTNVTNEMGASDNKRPAWSPDGAQLLFLTQRDGNREVYTMKADGTTPTNLSNDAAADEPGTWSPCR